MCLTALKKILKQIVQIWYQFDVDGDVVTWPSPWYVTSSGRTNQEQFVRRTQRRRRCFFSARPYVLYPFLTQDTLKNIPKSYVSNIPIRTIIINHCPFFTPKTSGVSTVTFMLRVASISSNDLQWLAGSVTGPRSEVMVHLTNYAINKANPNFEASVVAFVGTFMDTVSRCLGDLLWWRTACGNYWVFTGEWWI